jgi:hypothetical protein
MGVASTFPWVALRPSYAKADVVLHQCFEGMIAVSFLDSLLTNQQLPTAAPYRVLEASIAAALVEPRASLPPAPSIGPSRGPAHLQRPIPGE